MTEAQYQTASALAEANQYDYIVGTHHFCGCLKVAMQLGRECGIPWIADMRDGWSSYHLAPFKTGTRMRQRLEALEKHTLESASVVLSYTEPLGRTLCAPEARVQTLTMCYDPESNESLGVVAVPAAGGVEIGCAGSITPVHDYAPLLQAIRRLREVEPGMNISLHYYGSYLPALIQAAARHGVPSDVIVGHGFIGERALIAALARHHVLVGFSLKNQMSASYSSGRVFDYLAAGRPILVVGRGCSEFSEIVTATGMGVHCRDDRQVAQFLIEAGRTNLLAQLCANANRLAVSAYAADKVARRFLELVEAAKCPPAVDSRIGSPRR